VHQNSRSYEFADLSDVRETRWECEFRSSECSNPSHPIRPWIYVIVLHYAVTWRFRLTLRHAVSVHRVPSTYGYVTVSSSPFARLSLFLSLSLSLSLSFSLSLSLSLLWKYHRDMSWLDVCFVFRQNFRSGKVSAFLSCRGRTVRLNFPGILCGYGSLVSGIRASVLRSVAVM